MAYFRYQNCNRPHQPSENRRKKVWDRRGLRLKICFDRREKTFVPNSGCIGILDNINGTLVITSYNNTYPGIGRRVLIASLDLIRPWNPACIMIQHPIQKLRQRPNRKFLLFHYWRCFRHFNWFSPSVQSGTSPQFRPMRKEENHNWIVESVNSPLLHFLLHKSWLNSFLYFDSELYIFG